KRREGSFKEAPLEKVIFTTFLYASPVQTIPSCDQTGFSHFHSSTISGSASLIRARIRPSVSPRQSPSSAILLSISREADSPSCLVPERFMRASSEESAERERSQSCRPPRLLTA